MFNERLPAAGGRGPQEEEFGDKNSRFGNGFHDHFGNDRGGRRADFYNQHGGGHRRDRHVHFDMKMKLVINMMTASMIMKILLHTMDVLDSHMNIVVVLVMMGKIIMVVAIEMI